MNLSLITLATCMVYVIHAIRFHAENENKSLIRRGFEEIWNNGRTDPIHEFRAPDAVATCFAPGGAESCGPAPFQAFYANMRAALPDLHVHLHEIIAWATGSEFCGDRRSAPSSMIF